MCCIVSNLPYASPCALQVGIWSLVDRGGTGVHKSDAEQEECVPFYTRLLFMKNVTIKTNFIFTAINSKRWIYRSKVFHAYLVILALSNTVRYAV